MQISTWSVVLATLAGPVLAVQAQKWLERWHSARERRIWVYKQLMATRGDVLSPAHFTALNAIDLEFPTKNKEYKKVIESWNIYRDHLNTSPSDPNSWTTWIENSNCLLNDLLQQMGRSLGYDFDLVQIKRGFYVPKNYRDVQQEEKELRKELLDLLKKANMKVDSLEIKAISSTTETKRVD